MPDSPDDVEPDSMLATAAGRWFLLLLEHGPDDPRTVKALDRARRHGLEDDAVEWAQTSGVAMARDLD